MSTTLIGSTISQPKHLPDPWVNLCCRTSNNKILTVFAVFHTNFHQLSSGLPAVVLWCGQTCLLSRAENDTFMNHTTTKGGVKKWHFQLYHLFCSRLFIILFLMGHDHRRRKNWSTKKTKYLCSTYFLFNQLSWGMQANQPKGTQEADYKKTITNQQLTSSLWRFTRGWIWWIVILTTAQKMKFLVRGITDDAASLCVFPNWIL